MDKKANLAQALLSSSSDLRSFVANIINIITGYFIPLIIALSLLVFLWGVFKTITAEGDGKKRQEGIAFITYGIIGLTVMVSVWSLVYILTSTFFANDLLIPRLN